jgi:hypothetical protein
MHSKPKSIEDPSLSLGYKYPATPVMDAMELDLMNGTNVWKESMAKELGQINEYETFRILQNEEFLPLPYKKIPCHMVFDVKFDLR